MRHQVVVWRQTRAQADPASPAAPVLHWERQRESSCVVPFDDVFGCAGMRREVLVLGEGHGNRADCADTLYGHIRKGGPLDEVAHAHTRIAARVTARREDGVGTYREIAEWNRSVFPEQHFAGISNLVKQRKWIFNRDAKMLRGVLI